MGDTETLVEHSLFALDGNLSLQNSGIAAANPGDPAQRIGVMNIDTLCLESGSVLSMDVTRLGNGDAASDLLVIGTSVEVLGPCALELNLLNSAPWQAGDTLSFQLFDFSQLSETALNAAQSALAGNLTVELNGEEKNLFTIDSANLFSEGRLTLTAQQDYGAIPEPTTATLCLAGLASLLVRRRR